MTITSASIMNRLYWRLGTRTMLAPNFTPDGWYECDMLSLTGKGVWTEYEIKVHRGDFFADAMKNRDDIGRKHSLLAGGYIHGPHRFYFVVPLGMVALDEVPEWAGLITYKDRQHSVVPHLRWEKKAPRLHDTTINYAALRDQILRRFYHRYWQLRCKEERKATQNGSAA